MLNQKNRRLSVNGYRCSRGFTFIELVIVIILLGLLAATALPRYLNATDDAEIASLEGVAGGFSTALVTARAQWFVDGNNIGAPTTPADKVAVNYDGKIVYMNENGWPANTDPAADASEDSQTSTECQEVWNAILQSPTSTTTDRNERANAKYFIEVLDQNPDKCRYEFILNNDASAAQTHYFEYDLRDGTVQVFKPDQT
jgi:MSHA pilin protein MshB